MMQGKGLYAPQGLTLRAVGDHSPRACASMVADFGLSAAGTPGAWRRSSSGARARNAAGTAARVLSRHARSERSAEGVETAERPPSARFWLPPPLPVHLGPGLAGRQPTAGRHLPAAPRIGRTAPAPGSGRVLRPMKA